MGPDRQAEIAGLLTRLSRKPWFRRSFVCFLILLPFIIPWIYNALTGFPRTLRIATGPEGGLYRKFSEDLAARIEKNFGVKVEKVHTLGSLENIFLLQSGKVDLAFYQPGTHQILRKLAPDILERSTKASGLLEVPNPGRVEFIANLYTQPAQLFVRRGRGIRGPRDLAGRRIAVGQVNSGDLPMSLALMHYYGLRGKVKAEYLSYESVLSEFRKTRAEPGEELLDAALITVGVQAPVFRRLVEVDTCELVGIPLDQGLSKKHVFFYHYDIPEGFYSFHPRPVPDRNISTIGAGAQLLTREGVNTSLVEGITAMVLGKPFVTENGLDELFHGEKDFALRKPEFPLHQGALNVYEPDLRPFLNPDFVESLAGTQSFIFAVVIAVFLGVRWVVRKRHRMLEHKLDRYMKNLLDIEARQIPLDSSGGTEDIDALNRLLDEVTLLRQRVLREITAHEVTEDRAVECFINMCHALSNKINAKISRQRFERCFLEHLGGKASNGSANGGKPGKRPRRGRGKKSKSGR